MLTVTRRPAALLTPLHYEEGTGTTTTTLISTAIILEGYDDEQLKPVISTAIILEGYGELLAERSNVEVQIIRKDAFVVVVAAHLCDA